MPFDETLLEPAQSGFDESLLEPAAAPSSAEEETVLGSAASKDFPIFQNPAMTDADFTANSVRMADEIWKSQQKAGIVEGLKRGLEAPLAATGRGPGLALLSHDQLRQHLEDEYAKQTSRPDLTTAGKVAEFAGALPTTLIPAMAISRIPVVGAAGVMAQFGSAGAYDAFIQAGTKALAAGKSPDEATTIGREAAVAGGFGGAILGGILPGPGGQTVKSAIRAGLKLGPVAGAIRAAENLQERGLGLETPLIEGVATAAGTMGAFPLAGHLLGRSLGALSKLLPKKAAPPEAPPVIPIEERPGIPVPPETRPPGPPDLAAPEKPPGWWDQAETWADDTLKDFFSGTSEGPEGLGSGAGDPRILDALAVKGAALLRRGVITAAEWTSEMLKQYGERIRPYLDQIRKRSEEVGGLSNASQNAQDAALHGNVLPLAQPAGPLPIAGDQPGIRPQTGGGLQAPPQPAQPPKAKVVLRDAVSGLDADAVIDMPAADFVKAVEGGLTDAAFRLGAEAKNPDAVQRLRDLRAEVDRKFKVAAAADDLENVQDLGAKHQLFSEAIDAALGITPEIKAAMSRSEYDAAIAKNTPIEPRPAAAVKPKGPEVQFLGKPASWWTNDNLGGLPREELQKIARSLGLLPDDKELTGLIPVWRKKILARIQERIAAKEKAGPSPAEPDYQPPEFVSMEGYPNNWPGYKAAVDKYEADWQRWADTIPEKEGVIFDEGSVIYTITPNIGGGWRATAWSVKDRMPTGHEVFKTKLEALKAHRMGKRLYGFPFQVEPLPLRENTAVVQPEESLGTQHAIKGPDPRPIPAKQIGVNPELMQFKAADNEKTGTNAADRLEGAWDEFKAGLLLLWEPIDGAKWGLKPGQKYLVANGHRRLEFGQRQNVASYNSQVLREADGFSPNDARRMAAEINIADGKGTIHDQVKFIRNTAATLGQDEALAQARRIGAKSRKAANIAIHASDDLYNSFINERIPADAAEQIALAAPGNAGAQRIGLKLIFEDGLSAEEARGAVEAAVLGFEESGKASQGDFFANTALEEAWGKVGKLVAQEKRALREQIAAVQGAARRPEVAKKLGVDVADPAGVQKRIDQLKAELERWEHWRTQPDLIAKVRGKPSIKATGEPPPEPPEAPPGVPVEPAPEPLAPAPAAAPEPPAPPPPEPPAPAPELKMAPGEAKPQDLDLSKGPLGEAEKQELGKLVMKMRRWRDFKGDPAVRPPALTPEESARYTELTARAGQQEMFPTGLIAGTAKEQWANDTLKDWLKGKDPQQGLLSGPMSPEIFDALVIKGAALLERGILNAAEWTSRMLAEYGERIRPYLPQIRRRADEMRTASFRASVPPTAAAPPAAPPGGPPAPPGAPPGPAPAPAPGGPSALKMLESELSRLPDLPDAPNYWRQRISDSFRLGQQLAHGKGTLEQGLSGLRTVGLAFWDKLASFEKFTPWLKILGENQVAREQSSLEARQFATKVLRDIPVLRDPATRAAITKYLDAGGDAEVLRRGLAEAPPERKKPYQDALTLSPEARDAAAKIDQYFERRLDDAVRAGIVEAGIEDYIHRTYERDSDWKRGVLADLRGGRLDVSKPGLAKKRIFQYDFEAERAGYKPVNDFLSRVLDYDISLNRALADRRMVKRAMQITQADGRPMFDTAGKGIPITGPTGDLEATLIKPRAKPGSTDPIDNRGDYVVYDHPAFRKWKWVATDADGKPTYMQGDVLVHKDALKQVKTLLDRSAVRQWQPWGVQAGRALLSGSSLIKQTMLDLSGFHMVQIGVHGLEHRAIPLPTDIVGGRGLPELDLSNPQQRFLVAHGMTVADVHNYQMFTEGNAGSLLAKFPVIGPLLEANHTWLFKEFIPREKMSMALHALERNRKAYAKDLASGKMTEDDLGYLTAKQANAAFGGLNYEMLGRSKTMQDVMRLALLAPDFLEARGRFAGQAFNPKYGREQQVALAFGAAALYTMARVLNNALTGDPHWEKENALSLVLGGRSYSLRTVQGDIMHLIGDPQRFAYNRLNPAIGRTAFEFLTSRDSFGRKRDLVQQAKDFATIGVPISLRATGEQHLFESFLNAVGITNRRWDAIVQMYKVAEKYKRPAPVEFIYDPEKDPFRPLKQALTYGSAGDASLEVQKLVREGGYTLAKLDEHFRNYSRAPFTGSAAGDRAMLKDLSETRKKLYGEAVAEKKAMFEKWRAARADAAPLLGR